MVLKYLTKCDMGDGVFGDKWNYVGGIVGASIYYDKDNESLVAALEFSDRPFMAIALHYEAYLLNENGKTIDRIRL